MDSSPPRYRPLQQPLTLENVGVIPSTKPSIDAFIREQRLNSRFYAEEAALEGKGSKACNPRQSESSQRKGLTSSPLLRPRIGIQQENDLASIKQVVSKVKDSERNTTEPKRRQDVARKELFYGSAFPETSRSRKRAKQPLPPSDNDDDDDDRINRLKERRERKRLRRSIMKEKKTPEDVSDIFQESEGEVETVTNSKKKSRGRKSKLPSGIAMMEAFTAANVKGSRLTLKPKHGGTVFKHAKSGVTIALSGKQDKQSSSKSVQKRRQSIKHLGYGRPGSSKDKATPALKDKLLAQLLSESSDRTSTSSFDSIAEESLTQNDVLARNGSPMEEETKGRSSQSWGIGSALPSEDQSIQEEHRPQYMASSSKEKVITHPSLSSWRSPPAGTSLNESLVNTRRLGKTIRSLHRWHWTFHRG
ncbi:hypothetical protein FRC14_007378 [Serendipita sp. 396]|nr:hypothetical protein FRC14_007378 [Serendipita sp. 396]KAG8786590.1 hypothetical protein FRC15_011138 [Serendipita sp. 397]KAG8872518.1 hypothetical protein FRC20_009471 [Serendipita sp. 405]